MASAGQHGRSKSGGDRVDASIGTTRNLTPQFLKLRGEAKRARGLGGDEKETAKLLDTEAGPSGQAPPPMWVTKSEKIRAEMALLKERMGKLKECHAKALLVSFGTESDDRTRLEALTRECQLSFKRLDSEVRGLEAAGRPDEDPAVRRQVQRQLAQALFKLSVDFRKQETRFLNRIEEQKGLGAGSSLGFIADDIGSSADPGFTDDQSMRVEQAEAVILERDVEIARVVETITELAQIMRDMSSLIVEQGTMLDRIDHNIVETAVKVEQGVKELVAAEKTQKAGTMMLCIIVLMVAVVLMMIAVIIRHH